MSRTSVKESEQGSATSIASDNAPKAKRSIYIQVNFIKVGEINTVKETFDAELMIKARWRVATLDGKEMGVSLDGQWSPEVFIENSVGETLQKVALEMERNDKQETFLVERRKFRGSFVELMELWDFPFDAQDLSILIKSQASVHEVQLVDETQELHKIHKRSFMDEQEFYLYKTVDSSIPPLSIDQQLGIVKQKKPSLKVTITAARLPHYYIFNMFLLMDIIVLLSFSSFGITVDFLPNRLQLCFVLVLTAVTFKNLVNAHIPKISYFTYLDVFMLAMTILLAFISAWHGVMTRVSTKIVENVDFTGLICLATFYFTFHVIFISLVLIKPFGRRREMERKEKEYQNKYSEDLKARTKAVV